MDRTTTYGWIQLGWLGNATVREWLLDNEDWGIAGWA
jgi:hypothetical protein